MDEVRVIELFAGVGGFRVGLERADKRLYRVIWSNQWEPATQTQHAWRTYERVFGEGSCVNEDIAVVVANPTQIPYADMVVGGFPCQDYSVARTLSQAAGIEGKKGVLWWSIFKLLQDKVNDGSAPKVVFLENVDRLVQSPASQRGRDFAIILQSLSDLGYDVEWRIINAADYGMPQRRKRTYILAYNRNSSLNKGMDDATKWMFEDGVFAKAFPVEPFNGKTLLGTKIKGKKDKDLADVSLNFNKEHPTSRVFETAGVMTNGTYYTYKVVPKYKGKRMTLGDIVSKTPREEITEEFYISDKDLEAWKRLKGAKREERTNKKTGFTYLYSEGGMTFPDDLDKPSRTIITGEGGRTPSRFKHVIEDTQTHRLRRLVPSELEQLDMFDRNHTAGESDEKRAFFMGNALVCGIVERVGKELKKREW